MIKILVAWFSVPALAVVAQAQGVVPLSDLTMLLLVAVVCGLLGAGLKRRRGGLWRTAGLEGGIIALGCMCLAMMSMPSLESRPASHRWFVVGFAGMIAMLGVPALLKFARKIADEDEDLPDDE